MTLRKFLLVVFGTIATYRIITYFIIWLWGGTTWWQGIYGDSWDHYQLGIVFIVAAFVSRRVQKFRGYSFWLAGVGTGMMIDEVSDIIGALRLYPLPPHFRDSAGDLLVIIFTYSLFAIFLIFLPKAKH